MNRAKAWMARDPDPIDWFAVLRDVCALAFLLAIAFTFLWWIS